MLILQRVLYWVAFIIQILFCFFFFFVFEIYDCFTTDLFSNHDQIPVIVLNFKQYPSPSFSQDQV